MPTIMSVCSSATCNEEVVVFTLTHHVQQDPLDPLVIISICDIKNDMVTVVVVDNLRNLHKPAGLVFAIDIDSGLCSKRGLYLLRNANGDRLVFLCP